MSDIERAYFFGDSLSDTGNVASLSEAFPYKSGRFSNGDVWVDYLTDELGIKVDPLLPSDTNRDFSDYGDGINFAVGGATSGNDNFNSLLPIGLEQQIDTFELLVENQRDDDDWDDDDDDDDWDDDDDDDDDEVLEDSVSFLWVGANDYYSFIDDNPNTPDTIETNFPDTKHELKQKVSEVVKDNIGGAVQDLIDLGAEEIVVFNLPDLDKTPLAQNLEPEDRKTLKKFTRWHNSLLAGTLKGLENSHGDDDDDDDDNDVNIVQIDVNGLFDSIRDNPSKFGFSNVTDNYTGFDFYSEVRQPPSSGDPNEFLFWDSVHPTSAAQKLVADLVIDELTREDLIDD